MATSVHGTSMPFGMSGRSEGLAAGSAGQKVRCKNTKCGSLIETVARKLVSCPACRTVSCLSCDAAHEGINCKTYQESLTNSLELASSKKDTPADRQTNWNEPLRAENYDKDPGRNEICTNEGCFQEFNLPSWATKFRCPFCLLEYTLHPDGGREPTPRKLTDYWEAKEPEKKQEAVNSDGRTAGKRRDKGATSRDGYYGSTKPESHERFENGCTERPSQLPAGDAGFGGASKELEAVPQEEKLVTCKNQGCDGMAFVDRDVDLFKCPQCTRFTCLTCQVIHESQTCEAYQRSLRGPAPDIKPKRQQTAVTGPKESTVRVEKLVSCSDKKCGGQVLLGKRTKQFECPSCKCNNCLECDAIHPSYVTCGQYQAMFDDMPSRTGSSDALVDTPTPRPEEPQHSTSREQVVRCCDEKCHGMAVTDQDEVLFKCPLCSRFSCLRCKVIHENMTCEQYNRSIAESLASNQSGSWDSKDVSADPPECSRTSGLCANVNCGKRVKFLSTDVYFTCPYCGRDTCLMCGTQHPRSAPCPEPQEPRRQTAEDTLLTVYCRNPKCRRECSVLASQEWYTCPWCQIKSFVPNAKTRGDTSLYPNLSPYSSGQYAAPENTDSAQPAIELHQAGPAAEASGEIREVMVYCKDPHCEGRGLIDMKQERQYECPVCKRISCLDCDAIHQGDTCPQYKNKGVVDGIWGWFKCTPAKSQGQGDCPQVVMACKDPRCPGTFYANEHQRQYECPQCRRVNYVRHDLAPPPTAGDQWETTKKKGAVKKGHFKVQSQSAEVPSERFRKFHCKDPGCGTEGEIRTEDKIFDCPRCKKRSCVLCDDMHLGFSCRQYEIMKKHGPYQRQSKELSSPQVPGYASYAEAAKKGKRDAGHAAQFV